MSDVTLEILLRPIGFDSFQRVAKDVGNALDSAGDKVVEFANRQKALQQAQATLANSWKQASAAVSAGAAAVERYANAAVKGVTSAINWARSLLGLGSAASQAALSAGAATVQIVVENGDDEVYNETFELDTREVTDWYSYFFEPFSSKPSIVVFDLPPYTNAVITVTISAPTGDVTCGALIIGRNVYLGRTQYGAESDALNFSRVERNDFGDSVLIPRRSVPKTNQALLAPKANLARIRGARTQLNAVPAVWTAIDDSDHPYYEALLILGYYRQFTINLAHPEDVLIKLELEEV
jgi:hypothetical protein